MTTDQHTSDPRPALRAALDQVEALITKAGPTDLDQATPCGEFDVRTLIRHLVAVLRKLVVVRDGGDMTRVADPAEIEGDVRAEFRSARADLERAWFCDPGLDATYALAWGSMTGRELLDAYTHEFTVHAWDLAQAVGGGDLLDPALAVAALDWFTANITAADRQDGGPFGAVVEVPDDADDYTRLAGVAGRSV